MPTCIQNPVIPYIFVSIPLTPIGRWRGFGMPWSTLLASPNLATGSDANHANQQPRLSLRLSPHV